MRGQRRQRAWMSVGFGTVLTALTYRDYPDDSLFFLGVLVWAVLIAVLWLIGDLFTVYRRAQAEAAAHTVLQERLVLARELHDSTARTLARVLLDAERAAANGAGSPDLQELATGVRQASEELRRSIGLLRTLDPIVAPNLLEATEGAQSGSWDLRWG